MKIKFKLKSIVVFILLSMITSTSFAGGLLTNTNASARFARIMALDASTNTDAAYYNPAGTIMLPEGIHFTLSNQSAAQERIINSSFAPMTGAGSKEFVGKASAPIIPSLQGVYRKGSWALSGNIALSGGGGKATFNDGLPSFESQISTLPPLINQFAGAMVGSIPGAELSANGYSLNQYMEGTNYTFGAQLGGTYKINDLFSAYAGFRLNIVYNSYEGHLTDLKLDMNIEGLDAAGLPTYSGMMDPTPIFGMAEGSGLLDAETQQKLALPKKMAADGVHLESKQSGWGVAPIIGLHFNYEGLNIGAKYEFKNSLNVENRTKVDDTGMFADGVNTAHDSPALFTIGASYDIIPKLTASVGYHTFFDKDAKMANDKQKHLSGNTNEYLAGLEFRINDMFLISTGGQITQFGITDAYQSDLSFTMDSYSIGFGGAVNLSEKTQLNLGYFFTNYSDYTKTSSNYNNTPIPGTDDFVPGTDIYTRTNKLFAIGIDFSF